MFFNIIKKMFSRQSNNTEPAISPEEKNDNFSILDETDQGNVSVEPDVQIDTASSEQQKSNETDYINKQISEFNRVLDSLKKYDIQLDGSFEPIYSDIETKFSNITPKMSTKKLNNFVVIDTETTGVRSNSALIELSAIRFINHKPTDLFTTLLKPTVKISEGITIITGITNEMIKNAPNIREVAQSFIDFVGDSPVVGHNLPFDIGILENKGIYLGKRKYYDTLKTSKKLLKKPKMKWDKELCDYYPDYNYDYDVENHKLDTLCRYYGIFRDSAHRASSDCLATGYLFLELLDAIVEDD